MNDKFGYMGLSTPFTTTDTGGTKRTYYPTGRIVNEETGNQNKMSNEEKNEKLIIPIVIVLIGFTAKLVYDKINK